jgi:hypothetical protein
MLVHIIADDEATAKDQLDEKAALSLNVMLS